MPDRLSDEFVLHPDLQHGIQGRAALHRRMRKGFLIYPFFLKIQIFDFSGRKFLYNFMMIQNFINFHFYSENIHLMNDLPFEIIDGIRFIYLFSKNI